MSKEQIYGKSVNLKGILDDPYCPECDTPFNDPDIDAAKCPVCGCLLDWKIYHIINDGG